MILALLRVLCSRALAAASAARARRGQYPTVECGNALAPPHCCFPLCETVWLGAGENLIPVLELVLVCRPKCCSTPTVLFLYSTGSDRLVPLSLSVCLFLSRLQYLLLLVSQELYYDRGNHYEFSSVVRELDTAGVLVGNRVSGHTKECLFLIFSVR